MTRFIIFELIFTTFSLLIFVNGNLFSQVSNDLEIFGTAKAGSYQMGTVKMIPAGSGFKSIRFENETEVLAEFNASVGAEPPSFKVGQIKFGNVSILNPSGFPDHLFFNHGGSSLLSLNRTESSMLTDRFNVNGLLSARRGVEISQNVLPFSVWLINPAPTTGTLEFFLNGALKARINTNGTYSAISDRRFKTSIRLLSPILDNVLQLRAKSYIFKDTPEASRCIGFIAQEVAELFPELVQSGPQDDSTLTLNYSDFGVLAIKAIQEQQILISKLENRIAALEALSN